MNPQVVVLTGAGISAESGIQTFRGPEGLWADSRVEDVATVRGYRRNPGRANEFYWARRADVDAASPNAAHVALAELGAELGDGLLVVTQNIDDLHERSGLPAELLVHMHGTVHAAACPGCGERFPVTERDYGFTCPACSIGTLRPDVVFFGEHPYQMGRIERAVQNALLFVAIGTSGEVYPAAGLRALAAAVGVPTIELNLNPTGAGFDEVREGPATVTVPAFVSEILASTADAPSTGDRA